MADSPVKGNQGKRYSEAEKAEMAQFIDEYNAKHKRGGMKAASEKYGISVVTLSNWGQATKTAKKKKVKVKKAVTPKAVVVKAAVTKTLSNPKEALVRMQNILAEISALEKEYDGLKKQL